MLSKMFFMFFNMWHLETSSVKFNDIEDIVND